MDALAKYIFSSIVLLLVVVGACTSKECSKGFPADLPQGSGYMPHLLSGSYIFPNITIQCSGSVTAIRFSAYFNPGVRYSSITSFRVAFYSLSGIQYNLETDRILNLNLESLSQKFPRMLTDANGRYFVSNPLVVTLTSNLSIPVQVIPGYTLGMSLPPTESLPKQVVSQGVSIVVQDGMGSQTLRINYSTWDMSETWLTVQGILPMVQLEFTEEALATMPPKSKVEVFSYYTAVGLAGLFACLFLFAVIIALILVVVIVVIQKRYKSVEVGAMDPSQQLGLEEDTLEANHELRDTDTERGKLLADPSTKHLQFYIVNKVGGQWKVFCRALGVTEAAIGTANANNPGNVNEAMMEALHNFSSGAPDPPFTWLSVLHALGLLGLTDYAKKLKCCIVRGELDLMKIIV